MLNKKQGEFGGNPRLFAGTILGNLDRFAPADSTGMTEKYVLGLPKRYLLPAPRQAV